MSLSSPMATSSGPASRRSGGALQVSYAADVAGVATTQDEDVFACSYPRPGRPGATPVLRRLDALVIRLEDVMRGDVMSNDDEQGRQAALKRAHDGLMARARPALEALAQDRVRAGDDFTQLCGRVLDGGKRRQTPEGEQSCVDVHVMSEDTLVEWLAAHNPRLVTTVRSSMPAPKQHLLCVIADANGYSVGMLAVSFAIDVGRQVS